MLPKSITRMGMNQIKTSLRPSSKTLPIKIFTNVKKASHQSTTQSKQERSARGPCALRWANQQCLTPHPPIMGRSKPSTQRCSLKTGIRSPRSLGFRFQCPTSAETTTWACWGPDSAAPASKWVVSSPNQNGRNKSSVPAWITILMVKKRSYQVVRMKLRSMMTYILKEKRTRWSTSRDSRRLMTGLPMSSTSTYRSWRSDED